MTDHQFPRSNHLLTPRWPLGALWPIALGLFCLAAAFNEVRLASLFLLPCGVLCSAAGVASLLWPGELKVSQHLALGIASAVVAMIAMLFVWGGWAALAVLLLAIPSWLHAGKAARWQTDAIDGVPEPDRSSALASHMAGDDALLGYFTLIADIPTRDRAARIAAETHDLIGVHQHHGWNVDAASYHREPVELHLVKVADARSRGHQFSKLSFDSEYEPHSDEPGRDRWLDHAANRTGHAWMLKHDGPPRPWLVAIHGYRMGFPLLDMGLFDPGWFHHKLGLNVLMPVLPLHGPRRIGLHSGNQYVDGHLIDFVLAEAQAMWDIRRLIGWLRRSEGAEQIGALGISLGGYNASLLATLESNLDAVIAGVPVVDMASILWHHVPQGFRHGMHAQGLTLEALQQAYRPVSPLAAPAKTEAQQLSVFAGVGDRFLPPEQALMLTDHWPEAAMHWYQGSHLSFLFNAGVRRFIEQRLGDAGLLSHRADLIDSLSGTSPDSSDKRSDDEAGREAA